VSERKPVELHFNNQKHLASDKAGRQDWQAGLALAGRHLTGRPTAPSSPRPMPPSTPLPLL
jgi:hypothetical protein